MRRSAAPKRPVPLPLSHVSAPIRLIPKRPRANRAASSPASLRAAAFSATWGRLEADVAAALDALRLPVLYAVRTALARPAPPDKAVAVCVRMGPAAAAGDRVDTFGALLRHVRDVCHARVVVVRASQHAGAGALAGLVEEAGIREGREGEGEGEAEGEAEEEEDGEGEGEAEGKVVVAVEDVEAVSEEMLRDVVYVCGKLREKGKDVALLMGLGTSVDALHSALGVQEATMIAPVVVDMPSARACLDAIVRDVLSARAHPVLLSWPVFSLIEKEFFERESTVSMVLRCLHHVYSMQLREHPVLAVCSKEEFAQFADTVAIADAKARSDQNKLSARGEHEYVRCVRDGVNSVSNELATLGCSPVSEAQLVEMMRNWLDTLALWKSRCHIVERVVYELLVSVRGSEASAWSASRSHVDLRRQVFKAFLVGSGGSLNEERNRLEKEIKIAIGRASKVRLLSLTDAIERAIGSVETQSGDEELLDCFYRLAELRSDLKDADGSRSDGRTDADVPSAPIARRAQGGGAAKQRRHLALREASIASTKANPLSPMRDCLKGILQDLLGCACPLSELPMYEVMLFVDSDALAQAMGGIGRSSEPRSSLFQAMRDPSSILGSISEKALPDMSIAYRLLAEGGRLKNLYDWYQTFTTVKEAAALERDENGAVVSMLEFSQAELQARFARACSELELIGLIKHTNRKTDHVLRLAFE